MGTYEAAIAPVKERLFGQLFGQLSGGGGGGGSGGGSGGSGGGGGGLKLLEVGIGTGERPPRPRVPSAWGAPLCCLLPLCPSAALSLSLPA
jgi:hypothetical protein